jgi:putative spermidine/putrescine transport system permease protein
VPYVVRTTVAALAQLDPVLLESSASLGASKLYTFRRITLPLIRPGILAGGFIAFMSSFDNVPVSLFLRDARTDMLPIRMWQDLEGRLDVTIAAVSGVMIVITIAALLVMERAAGLSRRIR